MFFAHPGNNFTKEAMQNNKTLNPNRITEAIKEI